jgi:TonB family protein
MSTMMMTGYYSPNLPWTVYPDDEERFRKILKRVSILFLVFTLAIPFLPVFEVEREKVEELPPRFAKLLLEREPPAAPPPVAAPQSKKKKLSKPKAKKKAKPKVTRKKSVASARQKAQRSGLLAFQSELAALRDNDVTTRIKSNTRLRRGTRTAAKAPSRSLITSNAKSGSGGISTAKLSRDTGGGGLAGRDTTTVVSTLGAGGGGGSGNGSGRGGSAGRSLEEIEMVFDRNKGAIFALYNRALRKDPALQGKLVLRLTISPEGQVTFCEVVSSELGDAELERKLVTRVKMFRFDPKNVAPFTATKPIDFFPA